MWRSDSNAVIVPGMRVQLFVWNQDMKQLGPWGHGRLEPLDG